MGKTQEQKAFEQKLQERAARAKSKYVKCADEDDDRYFGNKEKIQVGASIYESRNWLNPMFEKAQLEGRGHGWYPVFALDKKTNQDVNLHLVKTIEEAKRTYGAIWVALSPNRHNDLWRVSVWGADDDYVTKLDLTEEKANWFFDKIRDHITKRTLYSWGFKYD